MLESRVLLHAALGLLLLGFPGRSSASRADAFINWSEESRVQDEWAPGDVDAVALVTQYGLIRLLLRREWAPNACQAVAQAAAGPSRACPGCTLYRHEPAPPNWGVGGYYGPPYGLLQGGVPVLRQAVAHENAGGRAAGLRMAAFIPGSSDFFISTVDHTEWAGAFTVFAEVPAEDMGVIAAIPVAPYSNRTDSYNFTTRWLHTPLSMSLQPLRGGQLLAQGGAGAGAAAAGATGGGGAAAAR